jgi:hypothetical protein
MLCLDAFAAHLTPAVHSYVKQNKTTLSVIPGGCTGYVQVLDVSLNKPLKDLIKEEHDDHYNQHIEEWERGVFSVGDRRVLLTYWVARAWKRLHLEYKDTIINTFRSVELSLNPNSSEDSELKIKDLLDITVGDYRCTDVNQQEENNNAIAAAEVEAACIEAEEEGDLSNTVTDLRPQRERRPARDRYFLSQEAEREDLAKATTDTDTYVEDN